MLVFHGTGGDRALVEKICDEGLQPFRHEWAHEATGIDSHVFACTTPVGSRGGDPIQFAQGRAWGDHSAWLFVLDVSPEHVRGAVPNGELQQHWNVQTFASVAFNSDHQAKAQHTRAVIEHKRAKRCSARELLDYDVSQTAEGLCDGTPDAHTLVQFEHAYHRATSNKAKQRVAASYGLHLPEDFAADSHNPWCALCMHQLFEIDIVAPSVSDSVRFSRGSSPRLDLATFGAIIDVLDRWLAAHGDPRFTRFSTLQREYPPPRDSVPRTFWPDFATADLEMRMKQPDTQLLLDHVSPDRIVGAIELGTRDRLSNTVRPRQGETLIDKLWYLARQLVERRRHTDRPLVMD